jgi:hypothetical protein
MSDLYSKKVTVLPFVVSPQFETLDEANCFDWFKFEARPDYTFFVRRCFDCELSLVGLDDLKSGEDLYVFVKKQNFETLTKTVITFRGKPTDFAKTPVFVPLGYFVAVGRPFLDFSIGGINGN